MQSGEIMEEDEAYLIGMVANEIPADYEMETLKAQAVIARTNLMTVREMAEQPGELRQEAQKEQTERPGETKMTKLPESLSQDELIKLWGRGNFAGNYRKLSEAVKSTRGVTMTHQGKTFYADFHAVSAGWTRNGADVLDSENIPWLQGVESSEDIPSEDYLQVIFLEKEAFVNKIKEKFPEIQIDTNAPLDLIAVEERDSSDYVKKIKVGEKTISGEEFRETLELNSACFYIKEVEGKIRIVTKGLGHGLGMSQYGANVMAKEGADYREILSYYYKNIEISD